MKPMLESTTISSLLEALRQEIRGAAVTDGGSVLDEYVADSYWRAKAMAAAGTPLGRPDIVVRASSEADISAVLRIADALGAPVVPWGGGSGSQGGAVPQAGGIVLDVRALDEIWEIDEDSMTATVGAGLNGKHFEALLNERGLMFPHYPASAEWATVGGYIAARGSGVLSTKYGKIEDLTVSMRVVLPGGAVIDTLPVPRHAVGPDIAPLIIGSEGTLGIITRATVQIAPLPPARRFAAVLFSSVEQGVAAFREVMVRGLRPAVIRLYDEVATPHTLRPVLGDKAPDGVCTILTFEGEAEVVDGEHEATLRICRQHGATLLDPELARNWWEHRYDFYHPPHYPQLPAMWGTFDVIASYREIMPVYHALQEAVAKPYASYGLQLRTHFSHWYPWGTMYYARFLMPNPPEDEALEIHERIWEEGINAILGAGGVLNDHHGIGLKLAPWMPQQLGAGFETLQAIKAAIDPNGVMNPGKLGFGA